MLDIACSETCTYALCNDANLYSVGTGVYGQLGHQDVVHEKLVHFRLVRSCPSMICYDLSGEDSWRVRVYMQMESMTEDKRSKGEGR